MAAAKKGAAQPRRLPAAADEGPRAHLAGPPGRPAAGAASVAGRPSPMARSRRATATLPASRPGNLGGFGARQVHPALQNVQLRRQAGVEIILGHLERFLCQPDVLRLRSQGRLGGLQLVVSRPDVGLEPAAASP